MSKSKNKSQLTEFQIRNIRILTHLLESDAVTDDVVEMLRLSELDYFSLIDKYHLLEKKVNIDDKTNLLKFKSDYLTKIIKTASRVFYGVNYADYHVSFIRFDIDDFSIFNNRYGHDVGDRVLAKLANLIKEHSRPTDYVIRFGGEEFDVILPSTNLDGALIYMEKIMEKIRNITIKHKDKYLKVTVSAGVSHLKYLFQDKKKITDQDTEKLFERLQIEADNALYDAKYQGKNRYCVYDPEKIEEYSKIRKLYVK